VRQAPPSASPCTCVTWWKPWVGLGGPGQGLSALQEAIARAEETEELWSMAELLRLKGELLMLQAAPGAAAEVEDPLRRALDLARWQGALLLGIARRHEPCATALRSEPIY
jgi:hypothetical protein